MSTAVSDPQVDGAVRELQSSTSLPVEERIRLCGSCINDVFDTAKEWTQAAINAKQVANTPFATEDLFTGPVIVTRQLWLTAQSLTSIQKLGKPQLPGRIKTLPNNQLAVPVF
ncbi:MAG: hypothetical protein AAF497_06955, partial [Planctomycetota bacterium]